MRIIFTRTVKKVIFSSCYFLLLSNFFPLFSFAQSLNIYTCLDSAAAVMPLLKQQPLLQQQLRNQLQNYSSFYLPVFTASGQASYQSDVPELPFKIPNFNGLDIPKDQYRVWLGVSQPIYDAGYSRAQKINAEAATAATLEQLKVNLYEYKKQVIIIYFQILLSKSQSEIINQTIRLLQEKEKTVQAAFKNGTLQQNDLLKIKAEIINQQKNQAALDNMDTSGMKILSLLTGIDTKGKKLEMPPALSVTDYNLTNNPELQLIKAQKKKITAGLQLFQSERRPRFSFFGQAGIGSPNPFNIFKSETGPYYIAGLQANWTIWDWGKTAREKSNLALNAAMLDNQQQQKTIELNTRITQLSEENNYLNNMLQKDDTLYLLKKQIRENASHQLDEGIITSTDYLNEVLDEQQAVVQQNIDRIHLYKNLFLLQLETGALKNN